jgi:hypothetical protein
VLRTFKRADLVVVEQVLAGNVDLFAVLQETSVISASEQDTTRSPAELVAEGVVVGVGGRETFALINSMILIDTVRPNLPPQKELKSTTFPPLALTPSITLIALFG